MEASMPYLLPLLLIIPLSLYLFTRKKGSDDLPPGSDGWPLLGENLHLAMSGIQQLVRERMRKYSPVIFRTSLLGERILVLCGAEGNKFIFTNEDKLFRRWPPVSTRKVLFPDRLEEEPVSTFHDFQYQVLKPDSLKQYVSVLDSSTRAHLLREWSPGSVVRALPSTKRHTLELLCRVFLNVADPERVAATLLEPVTRMLNGFVSVPVDLPGTAFNRAIPAGRVVRGELLRIVKERRKELTSSPRPPPDDLLSKLVMATDKDARIVIVIVGLLVGHYDASYALTVVISFLAQLPHIYHQVLREQMEIAKSKAPGELLTWEDVEKMKYTWNVVRESYRLVPPGPGAFREAIAEFKYAGFTIPKGQKIYWTAHSTHYNPEYFPEPEKFDPSRFEGSGPAPYTYIPFGGGPKMCPGRVYTRLVILVFIHNLVTRFSFDKAIPNEKMLFDLVAPAPAHGLPLHLHPHQT